MENLGSVREQGMLRGQKSAGGLQVARAQRQSGEGWPALSLSIEGVGVGARTD